jgi:hypothetical protein
MPFHDQPVEHFTPELAVATPPDKLEQEDLTEDLENASSL